LCIIAGFYRYANEEGLPAQSPAVHVRRPRLDHESHATGLDRNEVGALLVAAGLAGAVEHALVSLLAINGLRVSEALGADIDQLGLERGHRTLTVLRNGGKVVTIPLAPRTARAVDLAIGERLDGPIFMDTHGERLDRHAAGRSARRYARQAAPPPCARPTRDGTAGPGGSTIQRPVRISLACSMPVSGSIAGPQTGRIVVVAGVVDARPAVGP